MLKLNSICRCGTGPAFSILSRLELPSFDPCVSKLLISKLPRQRLGAAWRTHLGTGKPLTSALTQRCVAGRGHDSAAPGEEADGQLCEMFFGSFRRMQLFHEHKRKGWNPALLARKQNVELQPSDVMSAWR